MRFLFNLLGGLLLAVALVFATADIARTLADGTLRLTTLGEGFASVGLPLAQETRGLSAGALDIVAALAGWPASLTCGLAALLLLFIARPPHRRGRFAR
ncbi:hypothetical protein GCM10011390_30680 [Aureimonas endophytica]|uniref:Uncharacterized protein n=1 Tax=Aureimonas endophytica TaxID=2027858 RepID=A0A917E6I2_9HYPH|nr:hypothetical protein [Aureimonas endophytica]GGE09471.1 hypothetical protein GCM10011390_30680 [Aureimonas endophytica]